MYIYKQRDCISLWSRLHGAHSLWSIFCPRRRQPVSVSRVDGPSEDNIDIIKRESHFSSLQIWHTQCAIGSGLVFPNTYKTRPIAHPYVLILIATGRFIMEFEWGGVRRISPYIEMFICKTYTRCDWYQVCWTFYFSQHSLLVNDVLSTINRMLSTQTV